jgi:hypothetical protein
MVTAERFSFSAASSAAPDLLTLSFSHFDPERTYRRYLSHAVGVIR